MSEIEKLLGELTEEKKALLEAMMKAEGIDDIQFPIKARSNDEHKNILSSAQERLWFLNQLQPENSSDNIPFAFRIKGTLKIDSLQNAFNEIIKRHEILRTTFGSLEGKPVQNISKNYQLEISLYEISHSDSEAELQKLLTEASKQSFDLSKLPLFIVKLFKLNNFEHVLFINMHHSISDGWSFGILYKELSFFYKKFSHGLEDQLPELQIQYADYASWQRKVIESESVKKQIEYWKNRLNGKLPVLELPVDFTRPTVQKFYGSRVHFEVSNELYGKLRALCIKESSTVFMVLLAAYQLLLSRYSGLEDISVGIPAANRNRTEFENLIGLFLNVLVFRADLSRNISFTEFLKEVRESTLDSYAHQDVPFDKLVEILHPSRELSRSPLFQAMLQVSKKEILKLDALDISPINFDNGSSQFELSLHLWEAEDGFSGHFEFNTDLFEKATINRLADNFTTLLKSIVENPEGKIFDIPILSEGERNKILFDWNKTEKDFDRKICVHQLIETQSERSPDNTAVIFEDKSLTFSELNGLSNQLAHKLKKLGVESDVMVGIYMDRSLEMMVALIGVLKAGGAYVPLDPAYPKSRLAFMIKDANIPVVITQPYLSNDLPENDSVILKLDSTWQSIKAESVQNLTTSVTSENLAYVIYTSGSTGNPKGVMVRHRNVVNFFEGMDEKINHNPPGNWLAVTSISFDISVLELFWTLSRGFKVVIQGNEEKSPEKFEDNISVSDKKMEFSLFYFATNEEENVANKYKLLFEGAKFGDENGFNAIWTPERHFHAFGGLYPNPAVTGAGIATITNNIKIRAGSCVSPLHNPIRIAEEWAVVDNFSNGRVGISFAAGWQPNDFIIMPENFQTRKELMFEQIETVKKLWNGETISYQNPLGKTIEVKTLPRPIQKELPVWITAAANPETFILAGEKGYNLLTHLLGQSIDDLSEKVALYRKAWRDNGHDPSEGIVTLMLHTYVGEDEDEIRDTIRQPMKEYLKSSVDLIKKAAWSTPLFKDNTTGTDGGFTLDNLSEEEMDAVLEHSFMRYYKTSGLFGTPESCKDMVDKLKKIDVDEIACLLDFGVDSEKVLDHLSYLNTLKNISNIQKSGNKSSDYQIKDSIKKHQISHMQCTPSMAKMILMDEETRHELKNIDTVLIGGEAFPAKLASELREAFSRKILNMYGPTETTIWSTVYEVAGDETTIPIGKPIANTDIYITDKYDHPVPIGASGELCIGGEGVVKGYLNRKELTDEKFVQNPFKNSEKIYKTGDLAKFKKEGTIEFLGRLDQQVKIRGFRIELGEIETILAKNLSVKEAIVVAREDVPGDQRLAAYVLIQDGNKIDSADLKNYLKDKLPEYMIPSHFVFMDAYPLTPNGKIDRKQLPPPSEFESERSEEFVSPENEYEEIIAKVWQKILNLPKVGTRDNFFDLGGHSLLAVQVHRDIKEKINHQLVLTDIFRFPTIKSLAEYLSSSENGSSKKDERIDARIKVMQNQRKARMRNKTIRKNDANPEDDQS
jgi:natural product biosynthesis luciferase-like monooxygenase protein